MTGRGARGFTIIETMMFLAISGALAIALIAGTGAAINQQRYRDSVNSFVSYLQSQYDRAANVQNNREDGQLCRGNEIVESGGTSRGTSDCTIIGRLLESSDGQTVTSRPVYAANDIMTATSDQDALSQAGLFVSNLDTADNIERYQLEWGTKVSQGDDNSPRPFSMLIVRSPVSSLMKSYIGSAGSQPTALLASDNAGEVKLCVDPSGLLAFAGRDGAVILPSTANASAVTTAGAGEC